LRERREDIALLCNHFINEFNQRHGKNVSGIAEPLRKAIQAYDWPGNVRELRNLLESMIVQDTDGVLNLDDLQEGDSLKQLSAPSRGGSGPNLVGRPLSEIERFYIEQTLELTGGNREEAAQRLGIGERTLYRVIQDWKQQDKVRDALKEAGGDLEKAAATLKIKPQMLQRKMKKWGMEG
jgi:two-component system response regulator HydG